MTKILTRDIQWLYDRVPDMEAVLEQFKPFFSSGAFLAGGFLRTAITKGSALKALNRNESPGDLDFFFETPDHATKLVHRIVSDQVVLGSIKLNKYQTNYWTSGPNSMMKFAYDTQFEIGNDNMFGKLQLIHAFGGSPQKILNGFDLANCKIATDGKQLYIREGWEELEENKLIHIDDYQDLIPWRIIKYINKGATKNTPAPFQLSDESKVGILEYIMNNLSTGSFGKLINPGQRIRGLLTHPKHLIRTEDVMFFMGKLGTITMCSETSQTPGPYTLIEKKMKTKDFAVHVYEQRKKK